MPRHNYATLAKESAARKQREAQKAIIREAVIEALAGSLCNGAQANLIARELFPNEYHTGDCLNEHGALRGRPCRLCAQFNSAWAQRVEQVRETIVRVLSNPVER